MAVRNVSVLASQGHSNTFTYLSPNLKYLNRRKYFEASQGVSKIAPTANLNGDESVIKWCATL